MVWAGAIKLFGFLVFGHGLFGGLSNKMRVNQNICSIIVLVCLCDHFEVRGRLAS